MRHLQALVFGGQTFQQTRAASILPAILLPSMDTLVLEVAQILQRQSHPREGECGRVPTVSKHRPRDELSEE
jgi:hypothetical protein